MALILRCFPGRDEGTDLRVLRHPNKDSNFFFQNGACLVGELFPHPVGVFCTHLEPPNCHISEKHMQFKVFRDLGPSPETNVPKVAQLKAKYQVLVTRYQIPSTWYSCTRCLAPGTWYLVAISLRIPRNCYLVTTLPSTCYKVPNEALSFGNE